MCCSSGVLERDGGLGGSDRYRAITAYMLERDRSQHSALRYRSITAP